MADLDDDLDAEFEFNPTIGSSSEPNESEAVRGREEGKAVEDVDRSVALSGKVAPSRGVDEVVTVAKDGSKPTRNGASGRQWVEKLDANEAVSDYESKIPNPAFTYPFELDTFQKQAILCLERHDNVFVAAHTSAGKTVVAEYAIAMSLRRNLTKVIYTSPIKALSNQKFRDFKLTFGTKNVGILTGDVQIQPESPCLVMTTEILLQMLYNSSEVIRDLEWVIFDEVHYCNDSERGHVWEKIFILLPDHISLVLLSATVSNIPDYAEWLGRTRQKKIFVISTTKRPVPLEHYLYIGKGSAGTEEKFLFVDSNNRLVQKGYEEAMKRIREREEKMRKKHSYGQKPGPGAERSFYIGMIRHLEADDKLPAIIFTFSRKRCDENGNSLSSSVDLTTALEKGRIHRFIDKSLSKLSSSDRQIRQVKEVIAMLKKGFGVHHSGILPILKEVTEILFAEGLVRILFATETFAMGVNMPARSVAFDSTEKFDSFQKRNLLPSEYIQMAGRAGRRGKDTTGTVLVCCKNSLAEISELNKMALGKPPELVSQFKLTYSMILNLLKIRQHQMESVMGKSFAENEKQTKLEERKREREELKSQLASMKKVTCPTHCDVDMKEFCETYHRHYGYFMGKVTPSLLKACLEKKFLSPGRLLLYDTFENPFTLGVVLSFTKDKTGITVTVLSLDVLEFMSKGVPDDLKELSSLKLAKTYGENIHMIYKMSINARDLNFIQIERDMRNNYNQTKPEMKSNQNQTKPEMKSNQNQTRPEMKSNQNQTRPEMKSEEMVETRKLLTSLLGMLKELNHEVPIVAYTSLFQVGQIDYRKDLKLKQMSFMDDMDKVDHYRSQLMNYLCTDCPEFVPHFQTAFDLFLVREKLERVEFELSPESLEFLPEYKMRLNILQKLGYINDELCLEPKGRTACLFKEHELVMTEMIFDNLLEKLDMKETAGILSGFVYQEKSREFEAKTPGLESGVKSVKEVARRIGEMQQECGMVHYPVQDFVDEIHFGLVNVTYEWAEGKPFKDIVEKVDIQEGIIVRTLQRLDEILNDVSSAGKLFGDDSLVAKMDQTSKTIRRDIVFAASLYTQTDPRDLDVDLE